MTSGKSTSLETEIAGGGGRVQVFIHVPTLEQARTRTILYEGEGGGGDNKNSFTWLAHFDRCKAGLGETKKRQNISFINHE